MGRKRATVTVSSSSSSDEEGRRGSCHSVLSRGGGRKRARGAARARSGAGSSGRKPGQAREISFDDLSEDFCECLHGFNVVSFGCKKAEMQELWVDKYKPCSLVDLAVNKKKVEQIKKWLEERLVTSKNPTGNNVLLITGQCGSGKSAVIDVLASELGAVLCEWRTPTPTLWPEHLHSSNSGIRYISKLDEFELFVEKVRKYRLLPLTLEVSTNKPVVFLIDDLPVTNGRVASGRLRKSLDVLIHSAPIPTVLLITEHAKDDANDNGQHQGGLELFLERAGACKVSFNPITVHSIKKTLARICEAEKCAVSEEWITLIANASGGDIRHAITTLQYLCLSLAQSFSPPQSTAFSHPFDIDVPLAIQAGSESASNIYLPFGRDETLSLFHALGKFLHNKRESEFGRENYPFLLKEQYVRYPSKLKDPEKSLSQSHAQARLITDFLQENVLDFISEEAIQDAWTVASYLSDADCLLFTGMNSTLPRAVTWRYEPEHISQSVAASVAVRGVQFGNSHPSSSRWHSIRTPVIWQVDQSFRTNRNELVTERSQTWCDFNFTCISVIATEYRPATRLLGSRSFSNVETAGPLTCSTSEGDSWGVSDTDNPEGICSLYEEKDDDDDEIEEW